MSGSRVQEVAVPLLGYLAHDSAFLQHFYKNLEKLESPNKETLLRDNEELLESRSADAAAALRDDVPAQKVTTGSQEDVRRGEKVAEAPDRHRGEFLCTRFECGEITSGFSDSYVPVIYFEVSL